MNDLDLDLCLEVVSRSCQMSIIALHSTLNISETVIEAWFQRTTVRKWHIGYQMVMVTLKGQTRDPNTLRAQYLKNGSRQRQRSKEPPIGNDIFG